MLVLKLQIMCGALILQSVLLLFEAGWRAKGTARQPCPGCPVCSKEGRSFVYWRQAGFVTRNASVNRQWTIFLWSCVWVMWWYCSRMGDKMLPPECLIFLRYLLTVFFVVTFYREFTQEKKCKMLPGPAYRLSFVLSNMQGRKKHQQVIVDLQLLCIYGLLSSD